MAHTPIVLTDFVVDWNESVLEADARARALAQTCEHDFARLCTLFDITGGFGAQDRINVMVDTIPKPTRSSPDALGDNTRYQAGGQTKITVTPFNTLTNTADADAAAHVTFVAELAEVLMTYRNARVGEVVWDPSNSAGEGLSAVCAARLYPDAWYTPTLGGPRAQAWFTPPQPTPGQTPPPPARSNWIDASEPTDTDPVSFGCAILFINYLTTQLPYTLHRLITCDGVTLAEKYRVLTGQTDAWNAFITLINQFMPPEAPYPLVSDNPFPFLDPAHRTVNVARTAGSRADGAVEASGSAQLKPCLLAAPDSYKYDIIDQDASATLTASTYGFAIPSVLWIVNDTPLTNYGIDEPLTVTGQVRVEDPNAPGTFTTTEQMINVTYTIADASSWHGRASALQLHNTDHPGLEELTVAVRVHDTYDHPGIDTTDTTWDELRTQRIQYEPKYYTDKQHCEDELRAFLQRHTHFRNLNLLLTLPDPAPHTELLRVVQHAIDELTAVAREDAHMADAIANAIANRLQVPVSLLRAGQL